VNDGRLGRRSFLTGAVVASGLAGCLGRDAPGCDGDVSVVFRSSLTGWYVSYPATTGLFDLDGEDREGPAERLAALAREAGYTAEYYFSEDYGRGDDDSWQVELHGDLGRATVDRLVSAAEMPPRTDVTRRTVTLSRGSELRWPWTPGLLDGRAGFLAEAAPRVGVSLPSFGPTDNRTVTLTERPDGPVLAWLRRTLSGRGMLRLEIRNVPEDDNPLTDEVVWNYGDPYDEGTPTPGGGSFRTDPVELTAEGVVRTGLYVEPLLKTVYRPGREDDLPYIEQARIAMSLDGRRLTERPFTDREKRYLRAYRDYIDAEDTGDRTRPDPPDLRLVSLGPREALRTAALLSYPEDARFGVTVERC
jgi:hypothetical protein